MAPRRGGNGGAGAEVAATGGRNYFEPPPLKRTQPWLADGSGQCDIIAGGVDADGLFKGIYVSGVHLMALMRTFQLSKVFMPCDVPTPVAALGQNLQDGIPLVIVTRGCFGRELDYGPGPTRNDVQKTIWQTARDMRAEMPQILITTIDVPNNLGSDMLQACLEAPLNEYRELMYQDGTWYTPTVVNAATLGRWVNENQRQAKWMTQKGKDLKSQFNRKKFDWQDMARHYSNLWSVGWRPVLEAQAPPEVQRRSDLKFSPDAPKPEPTPVKPSGPSNAEVAFKKALSSAQESGDTEGIMSAVTKYMEKANMKEVETLEEAIQACNEVASKAEPLAAFEATSAKFKILVNMNRLDEAMQVATEAKASAKTAHLEAEALKLIVTCHQTLGDLEKAVEAAATGKAEVSRKGDDKATGEAYVVLVTAHLAKGDIDEAITAATEATTQKGKVEAFGNAALAMAKMAKSSAAEVPMDVKQAGREAAEAASKAASLFEAQGCQREQADALKAAAQANFSAHQFEEALLPAVNLQGLGKKDFPAKASLSKEAAREQVTKEEAAGWQSAGLVLVTEAHLKCHEANRSFLEGGEEAMVSSARSALAVAEEAGLAEAKAAAQKAIADALAVSDSASDEAYRMAKKAATGYKALGGGEPMFAALVTAAKVSLHKGVLPCANWDAKQVLAEAPAGSTSYEEALTVIGHVTRAAQESGKPVNTGAPVPIYGGGAMTLV